MKISQAIEHLQRQLRLEGDIELTCTGSLIPDSPTNMPVPDVFETTVEHFVVRDEDEKFPYKRLRVYL